MAKLQSGEHEEKVSAVERVCEALSAGKTDEAAKTARQEYPFIAPASRSRRYTTYQSCQVFIRDGFIDRYAGTRLVFP